jgi:hypothetical protein
MPFFFSLTVRKEKEGGNKYRMKNIPSFNPRTFQENRRKPGTDYFF